MKRNLTEAEEIFNQLVERFIGEGFHILDWGYELDSERYLYLVEDSNDINCEMILIKIIDGTVKYYRDSRSHMMGF